MQNKSQVGGILSIVSGSLGLIGCLGLIALIFFLNFATSLASSGNRLDASESIKLVQLIYGGTAIILLIFSLVGIVGGIYAYKKRLWGLALAGAICSIIAFFPTGIIATIFVAQAQKEFTTSESVEMTTPTTVQQ